jgi:hypothetical protein
MKRECHVRFCEGPGVKLPGATRLVILCRRGKAEEALQRMRVNEEKTRICKVPESEFEFLGYTFGRMYKRTTGQVYVG